MLNIDNVNVMFSLTVNKIKQQNNNKIAKMDAIDFFKEKCKNKNTTKSTDTWMRTYRKWASQNGEQENLETLDPTHANSTLERFFCTLRKETGGEYEPNSLCAMEAAVDRYLREKQYPFSIMHDRDFQGCRDVLEGRARYLRQELGMGKCPNKAESLTVQDEEVLWSSGQLGSSNPRFLLYTMWYLLTQHFGLRARQEHYCMKVEDFVAKKDDYRRRRY